MLIRPTILSLLQMHFYLIWLILSLLTVFLIDYIFICYFVLFLLKLATFLLRHLAMYLCWCRCKCRCMWAFKRDRIDWISCTHLIMTPMRFLASTSEANLDHSFVNRKDTAATSNKDPIVVGGETRFRRPSPFSFDTLITFSNIVEKISCS